MGDGVANEVDTSDVANEVDTRDVEETVDEATKTALAALGRIDSIRQN